MTEYTQLKSPLELIEKAKESRSSTFKLNGFPLDEANIEALASLEWLDELDLSDNTIHQGAIRHLSRLKKLRNLELTNTTITNDELTKLLIDLDNLVCLRTHIEDVGVVREAAKSPHLRELSLMFFDPDPEWTEALSLLTDIEKLNISGPIGDDGAQRLAALPHLKVLDLGNSDLTTAGLESIASCGSLLSLRLFYPGKIKSWKALGSMKNLQSMDGTNCLNNQALRYVRDLPALVSLGIGEKVTDKGLAHVGEAKKLERLAIRYAEKSVTDSGIEHISKLKTLKDLTLERLRKVTDHGLEHLGRLSSLERLSIPTLGREVKGKAGPWLTHVKDTGLTALRNMSKLRELDLAHVDISDEGLQNLSGLKHLEVLDLRGNPSVTGSAFSQLPRGALKDLTLTGTGCDDKAMESLSRQTQLSKLVLFQTKVTDRGIQHLSSMKSLSELDVRYTKVTPQGLMALTSEELTKMSFDGRDLTSEVADWLTGLPRLKQMHIDRCQLTQSQQAKFRALPSFLGYWSEP